MKRDMDLARELLLRIEANDGDPRLLDLGVNGFEPQVIQEHLHLLKEAGLIEAMESHTRGGDSYYPTRLTWEGHNFMDAARDETLWKKTRQTISQKFQSVSFDVLKAVLSEIAKNSLLS